MNYKKFLGAASAALMIVIVVTLVLAPAAWAQSKYNTLYKFKGSTDGGYPNGLISDPAGNLYGTTYAGGNVSVCPNHGSGPGCGTVFKMTPSSDGTWSESVLYSFCATNCSDGKSPFAGLVFDQGGNLYGTTLNGGADDNGLVFELTPKADGVWTETVLYTFSGGADGGGPGAGLTFDTAGNLYGTASGGGGTNFGGVIFKLVPNLDGSWTESVLYSFQGGADGLAPNASLTFDAAGNLYSTTAYGGNMSCDPYGCGVVFTLMSNQQGGWTESVLYTFCSLTSCIDGEWPHGGLVFDQNGNLYGTTWQGGANLHGVGAFGTLFKLTPSLDGSWAETVLYNFCSLYACQDGLVPMGGVIFGRGGNLYGTTLDGGIAGCGAGCGVVFKLARISKRGWKETVLHSFLDRPGAEPYAGLMLDASGNIYGTTWGDGSKTFGSVFQITP